MKGMVDRYNPSMEKSSSDVKEKLPENIAKEEELSIEEFLATVELLEGDVHEMEFSQEEQEKMMEEFLKETNFLETIAYNMICTLPVTFVAKPNQPSKIKGELLLMSRALSKVMEENVMKDLITFEEKFSMEELPKKIVFEKLDKKTVQQLKPLYIFAHINGCLMK